MDPEVDVMIVDEHVIKLLEGGVVSVRSGCAVTI
jgi:hypothetical protein